MPNTSVIQHKRSSVPGLVPSAASLSAGEIAINTVDGKLFAKLDDASIVSFSNDGKRAFVLDSALSAVNTQYGNNTASEVYSSVLGGYNNNNSGAGSTVLNGENNDIEGNFATILNGLNNKISSTGDYSAVFGGQNNFVSHQNSFTIGSNLSSHASDFTYVNNLSVQGLLYGDGSNLTNITGSGIDTGVRALTSSWVQNNQSDSTPVNYIRAITQAEYNAIVTKDPNTVYIIKH
jgi:hypothetical protein